MVLPKHITSEAKSAFRNEVGEILWQKGKPFLQKIITEVKISLLGNNSIYKCHSKVLAWSSNNQLTHVFLFPNGFLIREFLYDINQRHHENVINLKFISLNIEQSINLSRLFRFALSTKCRCVREDMLLRLKYFCNMAGNFCCKLSAQISEVLINYDWKWRKFAPIVSEYHGPIPQNGYTTVPLAFIETLTPISR